MSLVQILVFAWQDLQSFKAYRGYNDVEASFSFARLEKSWLSFKALEALDRSHQGLQNEGILRDVCTHSRLIIWGIALKLGLRPVRQLELRGKTAQLLGKA